MAVTSKLQQMKQILTLLTKGPGFDRVLNKAHSSNVSHMNVNEAYFVKCLQLNVTEAGQGRCVCELKIAEEHQNRGGTLHGGMTATLVDIVSTKALMTNDNTPPGVSVDMSISYLRAAKVGEEIIVDAKTVKLGKSLAFLSVEIKNKSDGKMVATGSHTKYIGG